MIVRNEEEVLERCLDSIKDVVDEIILVDTGSTDETKKIGKKYTDQIFDFPWTDDFSAARNFAFQKGHMEYLMWMDADDILPFNSKKNFSRMKEQVEEGIDIIMMPYVIAFDEKDRGIFSYNRERIVKNHAGYSFEGRVHEAIPLSGKICYWEIPIEHRKMKQGDSRRNLNIYEKMEEQGEIFDARSLYYYARELLYHGNYEKSETLMEKFLSMPEGWKENKIDGTRQLAFCRYCMGKDDAALTALLKAMEYDVPRGETCCDIGKHFMDRGKYEQAVYWFTQALSAKKNLMSGAFIQEDCYGFLPSIWLCICYDRMGERKIAEFYNEQAGRYKPESFYYLSNKEYFRNYPS